MSSQRHGPYARRKRNPKFSERQQSEKGGKREETKLIPPPLTREEKEMSTAFRLPSRPVIIDQTNQNPMGSSDAMSLMNRISQLNPLTGTVGISADTERTKQINPGIQGLQFNFTGQTASANSDGSGKQMLNALTATQSAAFSRRTTEIQWAENIWKLITDPSWYESEEHRKHINYCLSRIPEPWHHPLTSLIAAEKRPEIKAFYHFAKTFEKANLCRKGEGYLPTLAYVLAMNKELRDPIAKLYEKYKTQAAAELEQKYTRRDTVRFQMDPDAFSCYQMTLCLLYASEKEPFRGDDEQTMREQIQELIANVYIPVLYILFSAQDHEPYGNFHSFPLIAPVLIAFQKAFTSGANLFKVTETLMILFEMMPSVGFYNDFLSGRTIADIFFVTNGMVNIPSCSALTDNAAGTVMGTAKRVMMDSDFYQGKKFATFPFFLEQVISIMRENGYYVSNSMDTAVEKLEDVSKKQTRSLIGNFLMTHGQKHAGYIHYRDDTPFEFSREFYDRLSSAVMADTEQFVSSDNNIYLTGAQLLMVNRYKDERYPLNDEQILELKGKEQDARNKIQPFKRETFRKFANFWMDFLDYAYSQFVWREQCGDGSRKQLPNLDSILSAKLTECKELREKCENLEREANRRKSDDRTVKSLMAENAALTKRIRELEKLEEETKKDQKEINSLRELLYDLSTEEEDTEQPSSEEKTKQMSEYLEHNVRGAFLGGHVNFQNKISKLLPSWRRYAPRCFIPPDVIKNLDVLVICTDHLDHATYLTAMGCVRNVKCKIFFIHNVNVNLAVEKIYQFEKEGASL